MTQSVQDVLNLWAPIVDPTDKVWQVIGLTGDQIDDFLHAGVFLPQNMVALASAGVSIDTLRRESNDPIFPHATIGELFDMDKITLSDLGVVIREDM
jgi:hypothetical protein